MVRIGYVQFAPSLGDVDPNYKHATNLIGTANADLLVLPELCNTGYMFEDAEELRPHGEAVPEGMTTRAWSRAAEKNDVYIVGGLAELEDGELYNSSVLVGPDGYIGKYQKTHLFMNEKDIFQPGQTGFPVYKTEVGRVGLMLCFDWLFPESARTLSLRGADIIANPANLVTKPEKVTTAMRTAAIQNGVFTVTTNRLGEERGHTFTGGSEIAGPDMDVLAKAGTKETVESVRIDPEEARDKRYTERNDIFDDRRPDLYES